MKKDWLLFVDIILILAIGVTTLYSTVIGTEDVLTGGGIVNRQLIFILVGLVLYFAFSFFDYRFIQNPQVVIPLVVLGIFLLVAVLLWGEEINNARRWLLIGSQQLQPSEFVKIMIIISTAWILSLKNKHNVWMLAGISFIVVLIAGVLVFFEPDASTSALIFLTWGIMAFFILPQQARNIIFSVIMILTALSVGYALTKNVTSAIISISLLVAAVSAGYVVIKQRRIILVIALIGGVVLGFGGRVMWDHVLADYQKQRVESFLNPEEDAQGAGFQVDQSKVAIGSGLLWGKGFGHGTQSKLRFLPEHQTDFVFAAFAEEFGLIGSLFLLFLYCFLIVRILRISAKSTDIFGTLLGVGIAAKLLLEIFINVAMNMGIIPATGIPLPLMSAGGSILLSTMIGLGLVQSTAVHRSELLDDDHALTV